MAYEKPILAVTYRVETNKISQEIEICCDVNMTREEIQSTLEDWDKRGKITILKIERIEFKEYETV